MKATGKFNLLGEEIFEAELSDFDFNIDWKDLSLSQKADFCSYINAPFLNESIEPMIRINYELHQELRKENLI